MALRDKRILVTGGAGFIGSSLVDALAARGNRVTVLDDLSTGKRANLADALQTGRVTLVEDSILNSDILQALVPQADVIFHLAVQCLRICFDQPHLVHDVNATGTLGLLETAYRLNPGLERFVYVSSSEVYGTARRAPMTESHPLAPTTTYGASKLAGELYTQAYVTMYGMPAVIARPFNTYGIREHHEGASGEVIPRFIVNLLNDRPPVVFGDGQQTRDFTYVSDTVDGLIRVAECDALLGEAVNIAYGQEATIDAIARRLLSLMGRDALAIQYEAERPADVRRHYADITKLRNATGFEPAVSLAEGLQRAVDWFKSCAQGDPAALLAQCGAARNWEGVQKTPCAPTSAR
ncbi:MAG: GDP-mannose 4,6-dehydratase [Vampirovibrionales bacterium]|nr:GDP-mannose 4,6-dehydratase [Vampirovibrionales bacterium]